MTDNVRKYILYAIGEILLVVIGILIALQVNNWNEQRVQKIKEAAILSNLNQEFTDNLAYLEEGLITLDTVIVALEQILDQMLIGRGELTVDEFETLLEKTFSIPSWNPESIIIEELKNSGGFSQLNDPDLRNLLFEWEIILKELLPIDNGYEMYGSQFIDYITEHGSARNLDAIDGSALGLQKSTIARNELSLLEDPKFENRVDNFFFLSYQLREKFKQISITMKAIIEHTN